MIAPDGKIISEGHTERKPFALLAKGETETGEKWWRVAFDVWEGGSTADELGYYKRAAITVSKESVRTWISPGVSFWDDLMKVMSK